MLSALKKRADNNVPEKAPRPEPRFNQDEAIALGPPATRSMMARSPPPPAKEEAHCSTDPQEWYRSSLRVPITKDTKMVTIERNSEHL